MRAVVQRVSTATVRIGRKTAARIGRGLVVFLGVERGDTQVDIDLLADKVVNLRIFPDEDGRMNRSAGECGGELLVVSQFTLAGDCRKGRRPSFDRAEVPEKACVLYEAFLEACQRRAIAVECGEFGAAMDVTLTNTGPVTMLISSRKEF